MQNNDQNERVRPKLASAADLKGGKARDKGPRSLRKKWIATIVCLAIVLGAVIGGYFVTKSLAPEPEEEPQSTYTDETVRIVEKQRADMDRMTVIVDGEERYTLLSNIAAKTAAQEAAAKTDDTADDDAAKALADYFVDGMPYFTVNSSAAGQVAVYSYSLTASKLIEENAADLEPYGLTEPEVRLRSVYHDGSEMTVNIGGKVAAGNYYYASVDDSHDVYMVYRTVHDSCVAPLSSLHVLPTLATIDSENMRDITVEQRGRETVQMQYLESSEDRISISVMRLVQPIEYDVHSERSAEIFTGAASIAITEYAGHFEDEAGKAEFGLAEPFAEISMLDGNDVSAHYVIGDPVPGNEGFRYITVDDSGDVYTVDATLLAFLNNTNVSYLVDQFANLVYIKRVNAFEITTADTTYSATIEHEPEVTEQGVERDKQTYYYEGQLANEDIFRDFYQVVIGTLFDKRIEDPAEYHLEGDAVVTVTYHMTYTDEPFVVEYVDYDRDYYAIRRDGTTLFLIRKEKVQEMVDTAELYRKGEYFGADDTVTY